MKRTILFLIVLILAVWVGIEISRDPGYLLMSYAKWTVEMPLWLGFVIIVVLFIIIYYILRTFKFFTSMSDRIQLWGLERRFRRSHSQTSQGLIELTEGHWAKAERFLIRSAEHSKTPLINYLSAARAAQEQGAYERRDNYLRLAHQATPEAEVAVGLTQAELQLRHGQLEQGLATLRHLQSIVPYHKHVLKLLQKLYVNLHDWKSLIELLPQCRKYKVLPSSQLLSLEKQANNELLLLARKQSDSEKLRKTWGKIPRNLQMDTDIVNTYVWAMIEKGEHNDAEAILRETLRKQWNDNLVELYGLAQSDHPEKQLSVAEGWYRSHKDNPVLLLTLGRLAKRNALWGKARSYLEASIETAARPESYYELGQIYEQLGEHNKALVCYKKGVVNV